jgi:hypothetical protein
MFNKVYLAVLSALQNLGLPFYPDDFQAPVADSLEFVKFSILTLRGSQSSYGKNFKKECVLIVRIFTATGSGPKRAQAISEQLDSLLQLRVLSLGVYTGVSTLAYRGIDPANRSLIMHEYAIPILYYGD